MKMRFYGEVYVTEKEQVNSISLKYIKIFGIITMFGGEGAALKLPDRTASIPTHTTSQTELSLMAQEQSEEYDFDDADAQAESARRRIDKKRAPAASRVARPPKRVKTEQAEEESDDDGQMLHATRNATRKAQSRKASKVEPSKEEDDDDENGM